MKFSYLNNMIHVLSIVDSEEHKTQACPCNCEGQQPSTRPGAIISVGQNHPVFLKFQVMLVD